MSQPNPNFWMNLPTEPAAMAKVSPRVIAQLCAYWSNMFNVATAAHAEGGRRAVTDVKALATLAAHVIALAAERRSLDSAVILKAHDEAKAHITSATTRHTWNKSEPMTINAPATPVYERGRDEVKRLWMKVTGESNRSVPMTLRQAREVFGYASDNGVKNQANRIGLLSEARGVWTFDLGAMTTDQRHTYEQNKHEGLYRIGKRL